jgi:hypothetical protein
LQNRSARHDEQPGRRTVDDRLNATIGRLLALAR